MVGYMKRNNLEVQIQLLIEAVGEKFPLKIKRFQIGRGLPLKAIIVYIEGLVNKDIIDRDILAPLMLHSNENLLPGNKTAEYLCERYIATSNLTIETEIENIAKALKAGKSVIIIDKVSDFVVIDTVGGEYRNVAEPLNETSLRGSREGFVENLDTNISMLERILKDRNLSIERFSVGRRSNTPLALVYIDDLVEKDILNQIKEKINAIDVDFVSGTGVIEQYIEESTYSVFPQVIYSERPDRIASKLLEGRIAVFLYGTPFVFTAPAIFVEFFHTVEDYYQRTILANATRLLRVLSVLIVLTLPSIYLTLVKFNAELIPLDFVIPIVQSRTGIPLTPFIEILVVEILIEFLREGGLRLPSKIAQTISIVGGIIIGDAAVEARVVSPSTLLVIGITTVSSFLIPNYEMSYTIRLLRFPMLVLANVMGIFGIATGYIILLVHLLSLKSFGIPYLTFFKSDLKDMFIRAPLWQMNNRPEAVPNNNSIRQGRTRKRLR